MDYCSSGLTDKESENVYDALCNNALEAIDKEDYSGAIHCYEEALKIKPTQIQIMGELCFCYCQENQLEEMLNLAKKALLIAQKRVSKDNIGRFYFYIAQYYKIKEQFEEAIKYFALAIVNKPHFVSYYAESAYCLKMLGKYMQAINIYEQIKEIDSDYAEKNNIQKLIEEAQEKDRLQHPESQHIRQGNDYEKQGKFKLANAEFLKAVKLAPETDFLPLLFLFKNEAKLKEDNRKIIYLGERLFSLLNNRENRNESSIFLESICLGLHKCYKSINDDNNAEKYNKLSQSFSHVNNAKKAIESKELEKALEEYKTALEITNNSYVVIDGLIDISFKLKQLDEAVDYAVKGLILAKSNNDAESAAKYLYDIATRYELSNYINKASEFYRNASNTATELSSKLKYSRKLAILLSINNNIPEGIELLKKCLDYIQEGATDDFDIQSNIIKLEELADKDSDLNKSQEHFNLGIKFFDEMKIEEATNEMQIALCYIPQDLDAMDILNKCLFKLKRYNECINVCREGYLICCRDRDFRYYDMFCYNLGNCFYNMNEYETALKYYHLALDSKPYDTDYLYFVGACYRNLGYFKEALEIFLIAQKTAPNDENITNQIAFCMNKLQNN